MAEIYRPFQEALAQNPQDLRDVFRAMDQAQGKMDDCFMDTVLGIPRFGNFGKEFVDDMDFSERQNISFMDFVYEGTAYRVIRDIIHHLKPAADDVVYDIGSGYGRFALYGALTTEATFKGVEFIRPRHEKAVSIKEKFGIGNAEFINANVLDTDMSDGTIFYMFNPFYPQGNSTQYAVENKLRKIADQKPITVVTYAMLREFKFPYLYPDRFQFTGEAKTGGYPVNVFQASPQDIPPGSK